MSEHFKTVCKTCKKIINTCRCSSENKTIYYDVCDSCKDIKGEGKMQITEKIDTFLELAETSSQQLTPQEVIEMYGGKKYFEDNFRDHKEALKYIKDNIDDVLSPMGLGIDNIPEEELKKYLKKMF